MRDEAGTIIVRFDGDNLKGAGALQPSEILEAVKERIVTKLIEDWSKDNLPSVYAARENAGRLIAEAIQKKRPGLIDEKAEELIVAIKELTPREVMCFLVETFHNPDGNY